MKADRSGCVEISDTSCKFVILMTINLFTENATPNKYLQSYQKSNLCSTSVTSPEDKFVVQTSENGNSVTHYPVVCNDTDTYLKVYEDFDFNIQDLTKLNKNFSFFRDYDPNLELQHQISPVTHIPKFSCKKLSLSLPNSTSSV